MAKRKPSSHDAPKKPVRTGRPLMVWVSVPIGESLDEFIAAQRLRPSITDVVELALFEFLAKEGFKPAPVKD